MKEFKQVFKHTVNILATALFSAVAFVFIALALAYKSLPFIAKHYTVLLSVSAGIVVLLAIAYFVLYLLEQQAWYRLIFCTVICVLIFGVIFYALCATGIIDTVRSIKALRDYIATFGNKAVILYIVFCFLQVVALPVPGSATVAAGVALFGPFKACIYSFIGIFIGSIVAFAIGRLIGERAVRWIVGKDTLDKWLKKVQGKDYLILSIMFLLPLFPDDVLCFIAGLSSMTWTYFLIMITITRVLSIVSTAYSIGFIPFNTWWGILIWIIIAGLVAVSFWLVCKYSDKIDYFIKNKLKIKR